MTEPKKGDLRHDRFKLVWVYTGNYWDRVMGSDGIIQFSIREMTNRNIPPFEQGEDPTLSTDPSMSQLIKTLYARLQSVETRLSELEEHTYNDS